MSGCKFGIYEQICIFADCMKSVYMKYLSVMMAVWYCLSIIGFDVHSCIKTGERFVTSAISGVECNDVHPEHSCHDHDGCCAHHSESCHHEGESIEDSQCCTNDIHVLSVETLTSSDNQRHYGEWNSNHCPCGLHLMSSVSTHNRFMTVSYDHLLPDSGLIVPDMQVRLNIWRI